MEGNEISMEQAGELLDDHEARRIGLTEIGPYVVSTVFLALDHSFGEGPPVLFETMVFTKSAWEADRSDPDRELLLEFDCVRYCTLQEAQNGHVEMCLLVRATTVQEPPVGPSDSHSGGSGPTEGPDVVYLVAYMP